MGLASLVESVRQQFGTGTRRNRWRGNTQFGVIAPVLAESLEGRYLLSAGDLDLTFGHAGRVVIPFGVSSVGDSLTAMAVQGDGKIVAVGVAQDIDGSLRFLIARYNNNGSLDLSFGTKGVVKTGFESFQSVARSVAIQLDGKIVVGGKTGVSTNSQIALARYNTDGSLDTSFGGTGKLTMSTGRLQDSADSVVLQNDGKIVALGAVDGGDNLLTVLRYNSDGSLDGSFGNAGKVVSDLISSGRANSVAIQPDNKIVVIGSRKSGSSNYDLAIQRFNIDGGLDPAFGGGGTATTDFGGATSGQSIAIQSDGKILALGNGVLFARFDTTGALDPTFGVGGKMTNPSLPVSNVSVPVFQSDGKFLVVPGDTTEGFGLMRFNSNGQPDLSFGTALGTVLTTFGVARANGQSVALQSDGKIIVGGTVNGSFAFTRYLPEDTGDQPPTIHSANTATVAENITTVLKVAATDPEGRVPVYGITGGADQSKFSLNFLTGALSFIAPPNFESPLDTDHDNAYEVQIAVSDGVNIATQNVIVSVTDVNEAPVITSNGGGVTAAISVQENQTGVTTVTTTDVDMPAQTIAYSITGGADASKFSISSGGVLTFLVAPDFEMPTDAGNDNVYDVEVTATDSGTGNLTDVQTLAVTVTDVGPITTAPVITGPSSISSLQRPVISWTAVGGATEYEVWVTKNPSSNQFHGVTVTQTSYTPPVDFGIGKFNLWVRAKNNESIGPWTPKFAFTISTQVTLQSMTRQQSTLRPTISWNALPGAVKYDVWIDDVSRGITQYIRNTNVIGTTFTPSADLPLGIYRASVRGIAADGTTASWSAALEFVTMQAPTVTQGQNPTFNRTPTFAWDALSGASKYEVIIRNRNTGATTVEERNITGLSFTPATPLADGPYRWWAVGVSAQGIRSFWTAPMDIYIGGRTELLSPIGSSNQTTPTLTWRPVDGAVRYDLWVNQVGGQAQIIRQQNLTGTSYTSITSLPTGNYRAWIRAVSSTGEVSPWSLEVAFTITGVKRRVDRETLDRVPVQILAALTNELQVTSLGTSLTPLRRISDSEEIQREESIPSIDCRVSASVQIHNDVQPEQFSDDLLVVAMLEFLQNAGSQPCMATN